MFRKLLLALPLLACASSAYGEMFHITVPISAAQERPNPAVSAGTGVATVMFDNVTGAMSVDGTFQNLNAPANNAHVHGYAPLGLPGQSGTTAGVVIQLQFDNATSGRVFGSGTISGSDPVTGETNISKVMRGLSYINIHTPGQYAAGEIRGQIIIPEPASMALLAVPGLLLMRRRR